MRRTGSQSDAILTWADVAWCEWTLLALNRPDADGFGASGGRFVPYFSSGGRPQLIVVVAVAMVVVERDGDAG